jgi:molybdopterin synthase sulfur carrier subunit
VILMLHIMSGPITILYFAWLRERVGSAQEQLQLPDGIETVTRLVDYLSTLDQAHAAAFQNRGVIRCAVNREFADPAYPVRSGDEVAFFPPLTGG